MALSLHRRQIRRSIVSLIFGSKPHRPTRLKCEEGPGPGTVLVSWRAGGVAPAPPVLAAKVVAAVLPEGATATVVRSRQRGAAWQNAAEQPDHDADSDADSDDESADEGPDDDGDVTYRLRRQDPRTRKWITVAAVNGAMAYVDQGLEAGSETTYKLDAWTEGGGSQEVRLSGCRARPSGVNWAVGRLQQQITIEKLKDSRETLQLCLMAFVFYCYERRRQRAAAERASVANTAAAGEPASTLIYTHSGA